MITRYMLGIALAAMPVSAMAQDTDKAKPQLDEIVVTAQKRAESIQDVPISVSAIGAETIQDSNMEGLDDLAAYAPNTQITASPTFNFIYIRGLGSGFNKGFEQSVGLFLDGVYLGRGSYLDAAFLDLERVEVLRGPQGTLFGKNTIAGAINITSVKPHNEWEAQIILDAGPRDKQKGTAILNVPLFDRLFVRASVMKNDQDGAIFNTTRDMAEANNDILTGRLKIRLDVADWLDVTLTASQEETKQDGPGLQLTAATDDQLTLFRSFDPETEANPFDDRGSMDLPAFSNRETNSIGFRADATAWGYDLAWINSYSKFDEDTFFDADFSPAPLLFLRLDEEYSQFSSELRVISPLDMLDGKLDYVAGLFYFESLFDTDSIVDAAPLDDPLGILTDLVLPQSLQPFAPKVGEDQSIYAERQWGEMHQETWTFAAYWQGNWHLTETLTAIGGLRYSYEQKDLRFTQELTTGGTPVDGPIFTQVTGSTEFDETRTRSESHLTPKASLRWKITDELTTYATYAQGYKAGGYNEATADASNLEYEAEESTTYEGGIKGRFFSGAATANLGVFRTEFQDLQVSSYTGTEWIVNNAAAAISQGIEFDGAVITPWGIMANASFAILDATYEDFDNAPCPAGQDGTCDLTDQTLANAPEFHSSVVINYMNELGNLPFDLIVGGDWLYSTGKFLATDLDPIDYAPEHHLFNARLVIKGDDDNWAAQIFVRNVADKRVIIGSTDAPLLAGQHFGGANRGRETEFTFRVRF